MKFLIILISVLYTCWGLPQQYEKDEGRIMGGNEAAKGSAPYQVSLSSNFGGHFCGGSILNKRWILTAAHCLRENDVSTAAVVAGSNDLHDLKAQRIDVEKFVVHEEYVGPVNGRYADIGLVKLKKDLVFNDNAKPVKIAKRAVEEGEVLKVTGWGNLGPDGAAPPLLQETYTNALSDKQCEEKSAVKPNSQMCVLVGENHGMCHGDSGGPIVTKDAEQVGIASFLFFTCGTGLPDFCTKVSDFADWIDKHINNL